MAKGDWMPTSGEAILRMATTWRTYIPAISDRLQITEEAMASLTGKTSGFETLFQTPKAARTPAMNALLRTARKELEAAMRDVKRRYFFSPPLVDADLISLGLKPKDAIPTPVGDPVGLVTATIKYPNEGAHELGIKHVEGTPYDARANYGTKIRSVVMPIDDPSPNEVKALTESRFTRRKKELFTYGKQDRKKMAYYCFRYENSKGKAGQWSSIIAAVIP